MIEVFTDGSADNMSQKVGGIGVYFYDPKFQKHNISKRVECRGCTNQRMEIQACVEAIERVIAFSDIKNKNVWNLRIYTDSQFTIDVVTKYAPDWIKLGWTKKTKGDIKNLELIKKLYVLSVCYSVEYVHVNSHRAEPRDRDSEEWKRWFGNRMADKLALDARTGEKN